MVCASCGTANAATRRFCLQCGSPLVVACPDCGASNEPEARFCGSCGVGLGAASPAADTIAAGSPARGPIAERRVVSVLFADLVGFTPFAEERDAEDVRDTLTRYFELATEVIGRYGGTVEKFIGDAVMAVWGAPVAHEDDAERAVRAGMDLVDAVHVLGPTIQARGGVLTGEAAVTVGATNQGLVAGDLVNTAARLQSVAPPGSVLVGETTRLAASRVIAFEPAGEQLLKGKSSPVPAFRALRVVADRGGRNREALEAPFVGREDELRLLKDLHHATARERRARLVSVIGPAGIGKSRLAWELLKYLDGLVDDVWWHDGRSPAYGDGLTFWALGEMIRSRAGLLEGDDEATTRKRVAEMLERHVPDDDERRWIEPAMLTLLGVERGVPGEHLFGAWRTFFERMAASAPVVLVFEDLHHADTGLLAFIDELVDWAKGSPIYVLTLARQELLDRRPDWGAGKRSFTSLHLEPLPEPAMRELLAGLVPGLPEASIRPIVARADGIPLYAVETVRMLLADGRLEERNGAYAPVGDLGALAIPDSLSALIASRLDGLDGGDRVLVSDAAVLGQSFTSPGLAALSSRAEADLEASLRRLVRREILSITADPRSPERGQYTFVQALIREVAYNTLSRPERKTRHLAAARYLEGIGSDELAGALANHYVAAQANAPEGPERDALAGQARIALEGAAQRAAGLGSHDAAIAYLEQALAITSEPAARAELLTRLGESATFAARYQLAESSWMETARIAREIGDRARAAAAVAAAGEVLTSARRTRQALSLLEPAVAEFQDLGTDPGVLKLRSQLARARLFLDDYQGSLDDLEPVLAAAERDDLTGLLSDALVTKGSALASLGRVREGVGVIGIGVDIARAHGHALTLLRGLRNRSATLWAEDTAEASRAMQEEALQLARRVGERSVAIDTIQTLGWVIGLFEGDVDGALGMLAEALAEPLEPSEEVQLLQGRAIYEGWRGQPVDDDLARLDSLARTFSQPSMMNMGVNTRGWIGIAAGPVVEARRLFKASIAGVEPGVMDLTMTGRMALWDRDLDDAASLIGQFEALGIHLPASEIRGRSLAAGVMALRGDVSAAGVRYAQVLDDWGRLGQRWEVAFTAIDMAFVLDPRSDVVRRAADDARRIFEGMGFGPLIKRLDDALSREVTGNADLAPAPDGSLADAAPARSGPGA